MTEPPVTLTALVQFHREVVAPAFQRVFERIDRVDRRLDEIDGRLREVCDRFDCLETDHSAVQAGLASIDDPVDELGMRFEGTEHLLGQLAEQILELRTAGVIIDPPSCH
jgi:hypothetical protein